MGAPSHVPPYRCRHTSAGVGEESVHLYVLSLFPASTPNDGACDVWPPTRERDESTTCRREEAAAAAALRIRIGGSCWKCWTDAGVEGWARAHIQTRFAHPRPDSAGDSLTACGLAIGLFSVSLSVIFSGKFLTKLTASAFFDRFSCRHASFAGYARLTVESLG
jgi:hypothetical protein